MASIQDAVNKNVQRYAAGGEPGTAPQSPATPFIAAPPQDLPIQAPQRGQIPISSVNPADINDSNRMYRGQGSRSATYPYPNRPAIATATSSAQAVTAAISPATAALLIQVNGAPTPVQDILDLIAGTGVTLTPDATGGITIDSAGGDGLIHGDAIWDVDSAAVRMYDDFLQFNVIGGSFTGDFISALPWASIPSGGGQFQWTGAPPYLGQVGYPANSTAYTGAASATSILYPYSQGVGSPSGGSPLMDYPSWKMVWNFALGRNYRVFNSGGGQPVAFSWSQVSFYIGLANTIPSATALASVNSARPNNFVGLRYDTDPGVTYAISSAAAADVSGNTAYTGVFTGGATNAFVGQHFTVTGFVTHTSNNIVNALCVASTATKLTLVNAGGLVESATAHAAEIGTADTQFVFECVSNLNFSVQRNSAQGNTFATGMTVTEGTNYRFEIVCTTAGSVTMTLSNGTTSVTATLAVPTISFPAPAATGVTQTLAGFVKNGLGIIDNNSTPLVPFAAGSKITTSGWSAALTTFTGTRTLMGNISAGQINFLSAAANTGPTAQSATMSGYPALGPWMGFGNDSQATPVANSKVVFIDAFEFVWNPGVAGTSSATANATLPRYF